jgi:uncharacterized membrane protein YfcA
VIVGLALLGGGVAAGLFGSLLGLGGGILIVPLLTLAFGLPLITAVGVSLVCVIMTSGAAASVYLERRVANLRLGMTLELFTAIGALAGGMVAFLIPERTLEGLFAALLVYTALTMARRREPTRADTTPAAQPAGPEDDARDDAIAIDTAPADADRAQLAASTGAAPIAVVGSAAPATVATTSFVAGLAGPGYTVHRLGPGIVGALGAGVASALLGIGGGLVKVPVMNVVMGVPLRVATATSNLMIGITASAGAIIYLIRGGLDAYAAAPTAIGVFIGASVGSRVAHRIRLPVLRGLFVVILLYTAWQMLQRALG